LEEKSKAVKPTNKYDNLLQWLSKLENAAVAYSGGVDSTFLLMSCKNALGKNLLAITLKTPYIPESEIAESKAFCLENGIRQRVIEAGIIPEIVNNPEHRCYLCKRFLFGRLKEEASREGINHVLDGSNADDASAYRPGMKALQELGIKSPLLETGITKSEVRRLSATMGLPTAEKPSYACLLTRLPYNYPVKTKELERIDKAEKFLANLGYAGSRVRNQGYTARIELPGNAIAGFVSSPDAEKTVQYFKKLGYKYISIDLEGYRSGSFDQP
jgi:uncharacterized protein